MATIAELEAKIDALLEVQASGIKRTKIGRHEIEYKDNIQGDIDALREEVASMRAGGNLTAKSGIAVDM